VGFSNVATGGGFLRGGVVVVVLFVKVFFVCFEEIFVS